MARIRAAITGARTHRWSPLQRALVIVAITLISGSPFLTTYSLALGDPIPIRGRSGSS